MGAKRDEKTEATLGVKMPKGATLMNTGDLIPYIRNARHHSQEQVAKIAASMREFGFLVPILIDQDNNIIAGHGRLMAAGLLSLPQVPVTIAEHLTETQRRAYVLADNRLAELSTWDEEFKTIELEELELEGFDLALIGFGDEPEKKDEDKEPDLTEEFGVYIECTNESEQQNIFEELAARGLKCKIMS